MQLKWDENNAFKLGSDELMAQYKTQAVKPGRVARNDGDIVTARKSASKTTRATMEFPFLAHAALEPMNCVIQHHKDGVEIWNGEQFQTPDQGAVASLFGITPDQVRINMLYAGGSFGRRANPQSDYVLEAATIVKAIKGKAPVKLVWTREDDMRAGYYRPMYVHKLEASLDAAGNPLSWQQTIVGQSIIAGTPFEGGLVKDGIDVTSVEGAANLPYTIPNISVSLHTTKLPVPVQWWRSVGSTHTAFAVETFIDQLALAAKKDPLVFRRGLLQNHPRHIGVMELAAKKAGWGSSIPVIAPAVANALTAATGQHFNRLPLKLSA